MSSIDLTGLQQNIWLLKSATMSFGVTTKGMTVSAKRSEWDKLVALQGRVCSVNDEMISQYNRLHPSDMQENPFYTNRQLGDLTKRIEKLVPPKGPPMSYSAISSNIAERPPILGGNIRSFHNNINEYPPKTEQELDQYRQDFKKYIADPTAHVAEFLQTDQFKQSPEDLRNGFLREFIPCYQGCIQLKGSLESLSLSSPWTTALGVGVGAAAWKSAEIFGCLSPWTKLGVSLASGLWVGSRPNWDQAKRSAAELAGVAGVHQLASTVGADNLIMTGPLGKKSADLIMDASGLKDKASNSLKVGVSLVGSGAAYWGAHQVGLDSLGRTFANSVASSGVNAKDGWDVAKRLGNSTLFVGSGLGIGYGLQSYGVTGAIASNLGFNGPTAITSLARNAMKTREGNLLQRTKSYLKDTAIEVIPTFALYTALSFSGLEAMTIPLLMAPQIYALAKQQIQ